MFSNFITIGTLNKDKIICGYDTCCNIMGPITPLPEIFTLYMCTKLFIRFVRTCIEDKADLHEIILRSSLLPIGLFFVGGFGYVSGHMIDIAGQCVLTIGKTIFKKIRKIF